MLRCVENLLRSSTQSECRLLLELQVTSSVLSLSPLYTREGEDAVSTKPEEYAQFLRTLFRTKNKSFVKVLQTAYGKCADCNIDPVGIAIRIES